MSGGSLQVRTTGRGFTEVTGELAEQVANSGVAQGVLHVFICHTSASLIICENADPDVLRDLECWMSDLVPDADPRFVHTLEGPDDMAAHVRSVITATSLTLPISDGRLALGTWQGVFVWEHRLRPHVRRLEVRVQATV